MDLRRILSAVLIAVSLFAFVPAQAALDNKGTDFIMTFLPGLNNPTIELHLTSDAPTMVTVDYPVNSPTFTTTVAVNPGSITIVSIPNTSSQGWIDGTVQNNALRAYSSDGDEFVAYMINRETTTSDAALALPIDVMNTEYIALTYFSALHGQDFSEFVVVAAFDNTTVTITPSKALASGEAAGVPFVVVLDRGEGFLARGVSTGATGDLTGSIITSDLPVGMTNGNKCTNIPPGEFACDHIFEVAQATRTWGKAIMVRNLPDRPSGSVYRILASLDDTEVMRDGASIGTIDRGEFIEVGPVSGDHVFSSTNPIFVAQYMTGNTSSGATTGDPAMANMMPSEQYLTEYTFSTVGGGQFALNFVSIIAKDDDVGTMTLDGVAIPTTEFTPIGSTGYSSAAILLTSGTHSTQSSEGHGITVEGYNGFDSYMYPGGALFQFINPVGDANPPICELAIVDEVGNGTATDDRPSEDIDNDDFLDPGEDLNGNDQIDVDAGIFIVELSPGSSNLTLTVDPFVPGAPEVEYTVTLTNPALDGSGSVVVTDGAGNVCSSAVAIIANDAPIAVCRDIEVSANEDCMAEVDAEDVDGGSTDPDGVGPNPLTYSISPAGPFGLGSHDVILTVTDAEGATDECEATITVVDDTDPSITMTSSVTTLWPANHQLITVDLDNVVTTVSDNCDADIAITDAVITSVTSDEPENANGNGDGNTDNDMVIAADCRSVDLRAERNGNGNGRVYRIHVQLTDANGNSSHASYAVSVPKNNGNNGAAVENAAVYSETGSCGFSPKGVLSTGTLSGSISLEQNAPNPFGSSTTISYTLSVAASARITLYSTDGRALGVLVDGAHAAGAHTVELDGSRLAPGSYYYVLESNGSTAVQRLTITR